MHRAEKERAQLRGETEDLRAQLEQAIKQRGTGKPSKEVEAQIADLQQRLDVRTLPCFVLSASAGHKNTEQTRKHRANEKC